LGDYNNLNIPEVKEGGKYVTETLSFVSHAERIDDSENVLIVKHLDLNL